MDPKGKIGTAELLVVAAIREFRTHGYAGTDSNRIAARAGFAPQTFYRHFKDKTEIFLATYRRWEEEESKVIVMLLEEHAGISALADALIAHHRAYLKFRRSLRALSVENPAVRRARAQSRMRQIEQLMRISGKGSKDELAPLLLQMERLTDAIAEGEYADMGLSDAAGREALLRLISPLLPQENGNLAGGVGNKSP